MKQKEAEFLKNLMENAGEECDVRDSYGGRGMMGETTYAIVVDSELLLIRILLEFIREEVGERNYNESDIPEFGSLHHDNMGLGVVIY